MNIIEKHSNLIKLHFNFNDDFIFLLSKKVRVMDIVVPDINYKSYDSTNSYNSNIVSTNNQKSHYFSEKTSIGDLSIFFKEDENEKLTINLSIKQKDKNEISQYSTFDCNNQEEYVLISDSLKSKKLDIMHLSPSYSSYTANNGLFTLSGFGKKYQFVISDNELYSLDNLDLKLNITVQDIYDNNKDLLDLILINYDYKLDIEDFIIERNKIKEDINISSLEVLNKERNKNYKKDLIISNSIFSTIKKMLKYKNKP